MGCKVTKYDVRSRSDVKVAVGNNKNTFFPMFCSDKSRTFFQMSVQKKNICSYVVTVRQGGEGGVCVWGARSLFFVSQKTKHEQMFLSSNSDFFRRKTLVGVGWYKLNLKKNSDSHSL